MEQEHNIEELNRDEETEEEKPATLKSVSEKENLRLKGKLRATLRDISKKEREEEINEERTIKLRKEAFSVFQELGIEEIPQEVIKQSQELYDWLELKDLNGQPIDLQKEYEEGNIFSLEPEQDFEAQKQGYELSLIIPGQISTKDLIQFVDKKYFQAGPVPDEDTPVCEGVFLWDEVEFSLLDKIEKQNRRQRPQDFYQIRLRPEMEVDLAHPDTKELTPRQDFTLIRLLNEQNSTMNLHGLTLVEYLLSEANCYLKNGRHLEEKTSSWLLEESIFDEAGNVSDVIRVDWRESQSDIGSEISVDVGKGDDKNGATGARFVVVAKQEVSKLFRRKEN